MKPQEIKQIQRAIKHYKNIRDGAIAVLDTGFGTHKGESDIVYRNRKLYAELAISALEKQVPEKPILKDGEMLMHVNNGDKPHEWKTSKWQDWVCPECGCFVGQRYNPMQRRPHDQRKCNYCNDCGQAIDWSEGE